MIYFLRNKESKQLATINPIVKNEFKNTYWIGYCDGCLIYSTDMKVIAQEVLTSNVEPADSTEQRPTWQCSDFDEEFEIVELDTKTMKLIK